jgi:hypothetical protein
VYLIGDDPPPPPPDEDDTPAKPAAKVPAKVVAPAPVAVIGRAVSASVAVTPKERAGVTQPATTAAKKVEEPKAARSWKDIEADEKDEKLEIGGRHLAAMGLDWTLHETNAPPLFYPIRIIEHKEIFSRAAYLSFHISKDDKEPPRILLVQSTASQSHSISRHVTLTINMIWCRWMVKVLNKSSYSQ